MNYKELVKDIELEGLTLRKITNKYIKEHFDIDTLRNVISTGDGDIMNNEVTLSVSEPFIPEIIDIVSIPFNDLLMSQEMKKTFWIGFMENSIKGDFVRTLRDQRGQIHIQSYNKTQKPEVQEESLTVDLPEKEVIDGLKLALKDRIKNL